MKQKKVVALLMAATMAFSLAACGGNTGDSGEKPAETALSGDYTPDAGEKYTVETTADGWTKITNDTGVVLGLSQKSGVQIVEDDGYAFKDLNQNGKVDVYEDWRQDTSARVDDLLSQMKDEEKAAILTHGGWGDFTTDPLTTEDGSYTYLIAGGRGGVTRNLGRGGADHAKWTNAIQEVAESCWYGIPAMISIDPMNVSGVIETIELASTMDPELAAEIGQTTAKQYRASGVTALLGPQIDLAGPVQARANGTYGEDPALTRDIATAYVNAMQSTYSESGEDLGWGEESVYCFAKHFAGAGATAAGADDHGYVGRYAVFEGDNFEAHTIAYFDGVFNLPGKTGSAGTMTEYAVNVDKNGNPWTDQEYAGAYNEYQYKMLEAAGYDTLMITDWGVFGDFGPTAYGTWATGTWGTENMETPDRIAMFFELGGNLLGGNGSQEDVVAGYKKLAENVGADQATAIMNKAAGRFLTVMMNLKMFENPYSDSAYAASIVASDDANAFGESTQEKSVIMLKNDGTIKQGGNGNDKPTVYVPYVYNDGYSVNTFMGAAQGAPSWNPGVDTEVLGKYFNVVTDTLKDPSGDKDADGNAQYTKDDITRATADEIKDCDYVLVGMTSAFTMVVNDRFAGFWQQVDEKDMVAEADDKWYPASIQYAPYTATTSKDVSIEGWTLSDGSKENRSYKGNTSRIDVNYGHLEALEYANSIAGDKPVIVSMALSRSMVWSEVEPLADVILACPNRQMPEAVAKIILGQVDPNGLLFIQQAANMEAVEAQLGDVPRDMECYTDANGNKYDFGFGLNWAGVIKDNRTATYADNAPLTKVSSFDYSSFEAANKKH